MPEVVTINYLAYNRLRTLTAWYENAPQEAFGDRFHENVNAIINEIISNECPTLEDELDEAGAFIEGTEIISGELFLSIIDVDAQPKKIKVMAKL